MALQMIFAPPPAPGIQAATACPHYITDAQAARFEDGDPTMCTGCFLAGPPKAAVAQNRGRPRTRTVHSHDARKKRGAK